MKYKILACVIIAVYFFQTFFISFGGIGSDSLSYFGISSDLPHPETNLFPLGYPVLLKLVYLFTKDYFWASKIINLLCTVIILLFSYCKKFYFRETVLVFAGKTFYFAFFGAMSEGPFIFFMYFLLYFLHQVFSGNKLYLNAAAAAVMLIFMFLVRYSGIYIYVAAVLFTCFFFLRLKNTVYFKALLLFLIISGLGIGGYLLLNYLHFGSLTGEGLRGEAGDHSLRQLVRNIFGLVNAVDPFIAIKPISGSFGSMAFQSVVFIIDLFIFRYLLQYYKRAKDTSLYYFHNLLWVIAGIYGFALLISGWFQQIEELGVRLMAASNFCLFFSFLILYFQKNTSDKLIWRVSCFFFCFLVLYGLKDPGNYLENKKTIEPQMAKFKDKKYIYNDEKNMVTVTTYYFPLLDKSFKYIHTNNQKGKLKESIAGTINPKIKWIKTDTVRDKSKVLYTSQLDLR